MTDLRLKLAKILWGPAFANTLNIGYPFDNFASGSTPRDGSEQTQAPSGVEDAWTIGTDYLLDVVARYIPQVNTGSPVATGWDGATGFRAFLEWARDKNLVRLYGDAAGGAFIDCYLVDPMTDTPTPEADGTRTIHLRFRNSASAFDGY
jgi:hypothetical protein